MALISGNKSFLLFKTLIEEVFKKSGYENDFSLEKSNDKFTKIHAELSKISDKPLGRITIRNYIEIYLGDRKFSVKEDRLDILCVYINQKSWWFFCKNQPSALPIHLIDEYSIKRFNTLKFKIVNVYAEKKMFNEIQIVGDIKQKLTSLKIKDFYVDLSYIKKEEIQTSNSLLKKEKSKYSKTIQKEKLRVSEKLTETIISNNKRLIVFGNPGVGKSIFSRYLCHQWMNGDIQPEKIFIHITLKKLDFKKKKKCIPLYIKETYLPDVSKKKWEYSEQTIFVLDGYDEINNKNKKTLFESLSDWVINPTYILFTRPYGLLNQQVSFDGILEVLGFNESTRIKYIDSVLKKSNTNIEINKVINLINENKLLVDFSFNPLMLSYIMLIIINEGIHQLNNISSTFELQSKIVGWFERYYLSEKKENADYQSKISQGEKLAFLMEINQEYVFYRNSDSSFDNVTNILNETGIGRKEELNNDSSWRFYFSTATFQEFLAAKAVLNKIQPHHIFSLLKNQLYWNYVQMIIGGLSISYKEKVSDTLDYIYSEYTKSENKSILFLYILLLGETTQDIIRDKIQHTIISSIIKCLQVTYELEVWSMLIFDATARIYNKLGYKEKNSFVALLFKNIIDNYQKKTDVIFNYFLDITSKLTLNNDSIFIKSLIKVTCKFVESYEKFYSEEPDKGIQEDNTFDIQIEESDEFLQNVIGIIGVLFELINKVPIEKIRLYEDSIISIASMSPDFKKHTSPILDKLNSQKTVEKNYTDYLKIIYQKIENNYYKSNHIDFDLKVEDIYVLGIKSIGLAKAFENNEIPKKNQIANHIYGGFNITKKIAIQIDFDKETALEPFITSINTLQADNYIVELIDILYENKIVEWIEINDTQIINDVILSYFKKYKQNINDWNLFSKLCNIFNYTEYSSYIVSNHIESLYEILESIIVSHGQKIEKTFQKDIQKYHELESKIAIFKIIHLLSFSYERYYFFLKLTNSKFKKYEFIENTIIPGLIKSGLSNTSPLIWQYIHKVTKKGDLNLVLSILDKKELYDYSNTFNEIDIVLENLKTTFKNYTFDLDNLQSLNHFMIFYRIGFYITKTLINSSSNIIKNDTSIISSLLEIIFYDNMLKAQTYFKENPKDFLIDLEYFKLFPLYIHKLTDDEKILNLLPLKTMFSNINGDFDFCHYALEVFDLVTIKNYSNFLGKEIIENIKKHHKENIAFFYPIQINKLKKLV